MLARITCIDEGSSWVFICMKGEACVTFAQEGIRNLVETRACCPTMVMDIRAFMQSYPNCQIGQRQRPNQEWEYAQLSTNSMSNNYQRWDIDVGGVVIKNYPVESPTEVGGNFFNTKSQGILGLSPGANTNQPPGVPTTLENLASGGELKSHIFPSALTSESESLQPFYTFGFIERDLVGRETPEQMFII